MFLKYLTRHWVPSSSLLSILIAPRSMVAQSIADFFLLMVDEQFDNLSKEARYMLPRQGNYYPPDNEPDVELIEFSLSGDSSRNNLRTEMNSETGQNHYAIYGLRAWKRPKTSSLSTRQWLVLRLSLGRTTYSCSSTARPGKRSCCGYVRANYQDEYLHGQVAGFALTLPILVERLPAHANGSLLTALTTVMPFTLKVK